MAYPKLGRNHKGPLLMPIFAFFWAFLPSAWAELKLPPGFRSEIFASGVENALIGTMGEAPSTDSGNISGRVYGGVVQGDQAITTVVNADTLPDDRTLLYGPLLLKLTDTDGTSSVMVMDGSGNIIFKISSDGRVRSVQPVSLVRSISVSD